jgi:hypothetical protein
MPPIVLSPDTGFESQHNSQSLNAQVIYNTVLASYSLDFNILLHVR